jgi:protein-tyrosine phosphatase
VCFYDKKAVFALKKPGANNWRSKSDRRPGLYAGQSVGRQALIDLHCHLLPGIDDGAANLEVSIEMARMAVADGVTAIACTPHIFPGVYNNSGPDIRLRIDRLQLELDAAAIECRLVCGSDAHIAPDLVAKLNSGEVLSLNDGRYVLVEPPHHVLPPNIEGLFFALHSAGYIPILTHPERMSWADRDYGLLVRLVRSGTWMQLTAGSLLGGFGSQAKRRSERLLREGMVHIVASDAHDAVRRPPQMGEAYHALRELVGEEEAFNLVQIRPDAILNNRAPSSAPDLPIYASSVYEGSQPTFWQRMSKYFRAG